MAQIMLTIVIRTSQQRTTSEQRTKALLPKCPLFGGSTVHTELNTEYFNVSVNKKCLEVAAMVHDAHTS